MYTPHHNGRVKGTVWIQGAIASPCILSKRYRGPNVRGVMSAHKAIVQRTKSDECVVLLG